MSIYDFFLSILAIGLALYAFKDWFASLCGLVFMMAFIERMPKNILGLQGFNLWNILFLVIVIAWLANRQREGLTWDMPRFVSVLLLLYLAVILVGVMRFIIEGGQEWFWWYPFKKIISDDMINTIKWVLPGLLLFDGCRTRRRLIMVIISLLAMYFMLSLQVIKLMPSEAIHAQLYLIQSRTNLKHVGYNACNLSAMLAGAFWGGLAVLPFVRSKKYKIILLVLIGAFGYGQALTGGRAGYIAWIGTGLIMCFVKWRKSLLLAPLVLLVVSFVFEGAVDRLFHGFNITNEAGQSVTDDVMVTSGRTLMWPYVIDKIGESPMIGYGRKAMMRTGLSAFVGQELSDNSWGHPHNMYLETLLDNGIIGSIPIFLFWGTMIFYSTKLFRNKNRLCSAIGGLSLSLMLTQLITGIGSQHFYPLEESFGVWMAMLLVVRVHLEEQRMRMDVSNAECYHSEPLFSENRVVTTPAYV